MFAELYITDGLDKIDLLGANRRGLGIGLEKMTLSRPTREPAGLFRQVYGSVLETYEIKIADYTHDLIAQRTQQLDRILERAKSYHESSVENTLVYLVARTATETNPRYAVLYGGTMEGYDDVYHEPFMGGKVCVMQNLVLGLERTTWQASPPNEPECVPVTNAVAWNPNTPVWSNVRTLTNVQSLFITSVGTLLAGAANIERSADNGDNWTVELTGGDATVRFWQFIQVAARIWTVAGETSGAANAVCGIYYSDDDGLNWTQHTASADFYSLVYRSSDNTIFFGGDGELRYIQDGGALTVASTSPTGDVRAIVLTTVGTVVLGDEYNTWYVPVGTVSVLPGESQDIGPFLVMVTVDDYILAGSALYLSISRDDGLTWSIYWRDWGVDALFLLASGDLLASESAATLTYISGDGGFSWQTFPNSFGGNPIRAFAENSEDYLFAGAVSTIYRRIATDQEVDFGPASPSCASLYVANHRVESNWTHIFVFDSSAATYTAITPADVAENIQTNSDFLALPSPVGTNDVLYIGTSTALVDNAAFSNVYIELTDKNYTLTLVVEYWNGAAWTALTADNMTDHTQGLKRSGIIVWHLDSSVTMTAVAVNSITAYWIRIRVTATGTLSTLLPRIRNVYMVQKPYIEIDNLAGDIPALTKLTLQNELYGASPSLLDRATSKVILGLRSVSRGEDFTAYLNFAQKQNPVGVTVSGTFATSNTMAAAGEVVRVDPAATDIWFPAAYILLDSNLSQQFTGTYQIYLRLARYSPVDSTVKLRLVVESFVEFLIDFTEGIPGAEVEVTTVDSDDYGKLFYMGQFSIAPPRVITSDEATALTRITVFHYVTSDTASGYDLQELILIPADEWIGEFSSIGDSVIYLRNEELLEIDSATFPKRVLRSLIRKEGSNLISGVWSSNTSGAFVVSPAQSQRLWMVAEEPTASPHSLVHKAQLWHHARWLGLRGKD